MTEKKRLTMDGPVTPPYVKLGKHVKAKQPLRDSLGRRIVVIDF